MTALVLTVFCMSGAQAENVRVGSKNFTESYILGELVAQTLEDRAKVPVKRVFGIGGTGMVYESLTNGEIDLYVEYTGTIAEAILKKPALKAVPDLREALRPEHLEVSDSLGFNNTYALATTLPFARSHDLKRISDLKRLDGQMRGAFSYEFMSRADGFQALVSAYGLNFAQVRQMDHSLVYPALESQKVDIAEVYSTDAKIEKLDLRLLGDDRNFFPAYNAVLLASADFVDRHPQLWTLLRGLEGSLDAKAMRRLNGQVDIEKKSAARAVSEYLGNMRHTRDDLIWSRIWQRTKEHLFLVSLAMAFSTLLGLPVGILAYSYRRIGQGALILSGLLQTIPSLALLCFLIPLFGVGAIPALVALALYGLLPVVIGTFEGIRGIHPRLMESARALSLGSSQRLILINLPLASPYILAGVRTSAITSIGTATLAAFIGAGGYGAPIITGLAMNDVHTILIGAIPAAVMAIIAHLFFDVLRLFIVPRGLRLMDRELGF